MADRAADLHRPLRLDPAELPQLPGLGRVRVGVQRFERGHPEHGAGGAAQVPDPPAAQQDLRGGQRDPHQHGLREGASQHIRDQTERRTVQRAADGLQRGRLWSAAERLHRHRHTGTDFYVKGPWYWPERLGVNNLFCLRMTLFLLIAGLTNQCCNKLPCVVSCLI